MTDWLEGFDPYVIDSSPGFPWRWPEVRGVLWHDTEGWRCEDAFNVYHALGEACPHFTVAYREAPAGSTDRVVTCRRFQHVPLTLASYAVQHGDADHPCHVETNASGIIQIEVVRFASDGPGDRDELRWLGEHVLAPIIAANPQVDWAARGVYPLDWPRMGETEWATWPGGQCRHSDICCQPAGHSDPGSLDLDAILEYALRALEPKEQTLPDFIMIPGPGMDPNGPWLACYRSGLVRHIGAGEGGYLAGPKEHGGLAIPVIAETNPDAYKRLIRLSGTKWPNPE